jgi:hypothetical protein
MAGCSESGATLTNREKFICSQCHAPPIADQYSAAEWPAVIARMVGYMQAASNKMVLNAGEQKETKVLPDPGGPLGTPCKSGCGHIDSSFRTFPATWLSLLKNRCSDSV